MAQQSEPVPPREENSAMPLHRAIRYLTILCLAVLAPALPATAQGTDGVFPDPLDWSSFQSILVPLDLSPDQIAALEDGHSAYLEVMMNLRDGAIADFMEDHDPWFKVREQDADTTKDRINDFRRITTRFESGESNLFDTVESVLGPSQVERLQIVRDWRERQRKLETPWPWQGYSPQSRITRLELRGLIEWDELNDEQRAAVEQALATHESIRTRLARQLHEQRLKGRIREVELEQELGPVTAGKEPDTDPKEGWRLWQAAALERYQSAYEDAIKTDMKLRESLHRGLDSIVVILPDRQGRTLRWDVWAKAYPVEHMKLRPQLVRAIENAPEDVDAAELEALLATHDARIRPLHERAIDYFDQQATEEAGSSLFMKFDEDDSTIPDIQSELHDRNIETARAFQTLLGRDASPGLTQFLAVIDGEQPVATDGDRYGESGGASFKVTTTVGRTTDGETDVETTESMMDEAGMSEAMDMFGRIPDPISSDSLALLAQDIGAGKEDRDIIDLLHENYATSALGIQAEFKRAQTAGMMKLAAGSLGGSKSDKSTEVFTEFSSTIGAMQKSSIGQLRALDDLLFDDLVLAIEDADDQVILRWHRLARERVYAAAGGTPMGGVVRAMTPQTTLAGELDFMMILGELQLEPERRRLALQALANWHEPATAGVQALAELQETESAMLNEMMQAKDGGSDPQQALKLWEQMKESGRQRRALQDEAEARNELAADAVRAVLDAQDLARFNRIVRVNIHPMIYSDPNHMGEKLMAAMALDGLDESVRAELLAMHDDYTRRYESCCDQMVELMALVPDPKGFGLGMPDDADFKAFEQAKNDSERVRFERDDLSAKVRGRLQILLSEEQIQSIGGLKAPRTMRMPWDKF
jgi:hypothetical protein